MRVCIDTNALLQLFGQNQDALPIRRALLGGRLELAVSTEILLEYQEVITRLSGSERWGELERFFTLLSLLHSNILFVDPQFQFRVITTDPDDNKFVDCAIAAQAEYIITSDQHFDLLVGSGYRPQPLTPTQFVQAHL